MEISSTDIKIALAKRHSTEFFMTECKTGPTGTGLLIFDGLAIYKSWVNPKIVGYEIKVSRNDFLSDSKYVQYMPYCHEFYFVTPSGLIQRQEVEPKIGLMWYNPDKKSLVTKRKAIYRDIEIDANMLLYVIMSRLENYEIPFHSSAKDYWQAWLDNKIVNKELGWNVKSKLLEEITEKEKQIHRVRTSEDKLQTLDEILTVMYKHTLSVWGDVAKELDAALSRTYGKEIFELKKNLETVLKSINESLKEE